VLKLFQFRDKTKIIGYISIILASALFGSVPTIAKPIISNVNIVLLSSLAYLITAVTFTPIAKSTKMSFVRKDYGLLIIVSICGAAIAPLLYFLGLNQSNATDTSLLSNAEIVFTVLLALVFFKERLKPVGFVAVGLVLFGVTMITTNFQISNSLFQINAGNALILVATVFWALDNNISRIISTRINIAKLVQMKSVIGGTIMLGMVIALGIPFQIAIEQIPYVILLSVLGFGGSLYFFLQSLKRIGTVRTITMFSLSSVFGLAFASLFLHEKTSAFQIIAMGIMLSGIYMINRKESIQEKET